MLYITGSIILIISGVLFLSLRRTNIGKNEIIYISLIILYVIIFTLQINQPPFERYPGWDMFWGDARTAGNLISLKHALSNFEIPAISPYINFGWNFAGEPVTISFLSPINLLIMTLSPGDIILFRTIIFLILGGIGAYLFIKLLTNDSFFSLFAGLTYISIPLVISMIYYTSALTHYCLIPLFLYLIHKILETNSIKMTISFIGLSVFAISSGDVYLFVILPPVVGLYSLIIAYGYYHHGLLNSLKKTLFLVFLLFLSGSFYLIPLFNNLKTISIAEISLREAGFFLPSTGIGVRGFLSFFYREGFLSLFVPNEGSGLLLYIPAFFYFSIIIALIFNRIVFRKDSKQALIPFTLFLIGLMMFLISILFYSLPELSKSGKGVLRYHINLFPFMIVLAGFICFSAVIKLSNIKKKIIFAAIILLSFAVDLYIFVVPHNFSEGNLFNVRHVLFHGFLHSSNLVPVRFIKDLWLLLPFLNLSFVILLIFYSFYNKSFKAKKSIPVVFIVCAVVFIVCAMALLLLNISVHNELRLQQSRWQILYKDPYRWKSYLERKSCIDSIIDRNNINYRTLYVGKNIFGDSGRNWKLIAETELNVQEREKALFSYRETMHPYTGFLYSLLRGYRHLETSNLMPPLSNNVAGKIEVIMLMGVKYIISADEKIESPSLVYRGGCLTEDSSGAVILGSDGGTIYIYELNDPFGIAFLVDDYKKFNLTQSLQIIFENRNHPWMNNEVYLEEDPIDDDKSLKDYLKKSSNLIESKVIIERETFNRIHLNISTPKEKFLVLSYIYRPNWKAFLGSTQLKIYRAYGGLMCVKVPPGNNGVKFKYTPIDLYLGLFLTLLAFLIPFSPHFLRILWEKIHKKIKVLK